MHKRLFLIAALLIALPISAAYKWTMPDGSVLFSDTPPHPDAEKVTLPTSQMFTPPPISKKNPPPTEKKPQTPPLYSSLAIIQPENDQTIRNNNGDISVGINATPSLKLDLDHKFLIELDGTTILSTTTPQTLLSNIDRGSHTLRAHIADQAGAILITSDEIRFHLHKVSILH